MLIKRAQSRNSWPHRLAILLEMNFSRSCPFDFNGWRVARWAPHPLRRLAKGGAFRHRLFMEFRARQGF